MPSSVVSGLQQAVANTTVLTFLTLSAHWNIVGADFFQLHAALNSQYDSLFDTIDLLAERIRALDDMVVVDLAMFQSQAKMPAVNASASARGMIETLIVAHNKNVADLVSLCKTAKDAGDTVTENMLLSIIESEQKTLWMLKSYIK